MRSRIRSAAAATPRRGIARLLAALALLAGLTTVASIAHAAVEVHARAGRRALSVGETTTLDIVVRGTTSGVRDPEWSVPDGLEVLGTSRSQNVSFVDGKLSSEVVFRYEIAANRSGSFAIGPVRVRAGGETLQCPAFRIVVSSSRESVGSAGRGQAATLLVDIKPAHPYVGQPVVMRVRLVQRVSLAEDPSYNPPAAAGFWAERASQPESYYVDEGLSRVLVTETNTRLYPLAAGEATIGEASASLVLAAPTGGFDPLQWLGGRPQRREVLVRSRPLQVRVRPLPPGAPVGFAGAVGTFQSAWRADRARTSQDVPVTARFELRGAGNLPLVRTPRIDTPDFEQFASTVDDSLAAPGTSGWGLRRFQWTLLPRRQGQLPIAPPRFAWFDPHDESYHTAGLATIALAVGPPMSSPAGDPETFPAVFVAHPLDPYRRGAEPWAFAAAGLLAGVAVRLVRRVRQPPPDQADRAQRREWLHAIRHAAGPDFWSAAVRACEWLEGHGRSVDSLRRQIDASRYGGAKTSADQVRRELAEQFELALPEPEPRGKLVPIAVALAVVALALMFVFGPRAGSDRGVAAARAGDQAARSGDVNRARAQWSALWREGARSAGLAARLAWVDLRSGAIGPASLWALRGDRDEPRDPVLNWVMGKIRETGGLAGYSAARVPLRRIEWALIALAGGILAAMMWPRRVPALAGGALLLIAAAIYPLQSTVAARAGRGVVTAEVRLEGSDVSLEPGHVIRVLARKGNRARAEAGPGIVGWVPRGAVEMLENGS